MISRILRRQLSSTGFLPKPALRNILLLSLAAAVLLPLYVYFFILPQFTQLLVRSTEDQVRQIASYVVAETLDDLQGSSLEGLAARAGVRSRLEEATRSLGLFKLRLFDSQGRVVYSSAPKEVGTVHDGPVFRQVAQGQAYSKLARKGVVSADGESLQLDVIETYVPIMQAGAFVGAFEFYTDVTDRASLQQQILHESSLAMLSVVVGLVSALLYLGYQASLALTSQHRTELQLQEAALVFKVSAEATFITDAEGIIRRVNTAFTETTGYSAEEAVGQTPRLLKSGRHEDDFYAELWRKLQEQGFWEGEIFNRRKNGTIYPHWQTISAVRDGQGRVTGYVSQFSDVARRKLTEQEVRYRANYDTLTGLPNRDLLIERLERAILEAGRRQHKVALMFVDVDHFKQINDTLGHQVGDLLLQEVAVYLRSCVRSIDTVARQGGDEFIIVLPDLDSLMLASTTVEKVVARFNKTIDLRPHQVHVTVSVGVSIYPDDGDDIQTLFRNADLAMYRAKEDGRNGFHFYEPELTEAAVFRLQFENDLRQALVRDELFLMYQPIVEPASGRMVGVEALLRWRHPERGLVPPDQFIPVAEDIGLIHELGLWVLEGVCRQLAAWQALGFDLYGAVNVSARQIPDGLSPAGIRAVVEKHGLAPSRLVLEITEGIFFSDKERARGWIDAVRAQGHRVSLDDFGTGYSSLSYLRDLRLDVVKIDKSFVQEMLLAAGSRALVGSIINMGHLLGLKVVAEGVESLEQLQALEAMGCEYVQGYFLSRPVPPEQVAELALLGADQSA